MQKPQLILPCAVFSCVSLLAGPPEGTSAPLPPWTVNLEVQPFTWEHRQANLAGTTLKLGAPGQVPMVTVEVWGEAPQETLRLFRNQLKPQLLAAFQKGWGCDTSAQMLCEFMAMNVDQHAPTMPAVYYNCMRPSGLDPGLTVFTTQGSAWLTVTAAPAR